MATTEEVIAGAIQQTAPSKLEFKDLRVERLIVHRIIDRPPGGKAPAPKVATGLTNLNEDSRGALQKRISSAVGSRSHGIEMSIDRFGPGSFFKASTALVGAGEQAFIEGSQELAQMLATAQESTTAPAGMLAVIAGCVGSKSTRRFVAVIKADIHDGFAANETNKSVDVTYLSRLLLTPTQKLYKVGLLLELEPVTPGVEASLSNYRAFLFDHLLTSIETGNAAVYFYSGFLGMGIQKSSKKLTQDFFEYTHKFIDSSAISVEDKTALKEAVRVELRGNSQTIHPEEFAKQHFPRSLVKPYRDYLDSVSFPQQSIPKDTQYVKTKLRARKVFFDTGIRITAPSESAADSIRVIGEQDGITTVAIKGKVISRE